jgi:hypothetical protein
MKSQKSPSSFQSTQFWPKLLLWISPSCPTSLLKC